MPRGIYTAARVAGSLRALPLRLLYRHFVHNRNIHTAHLDSFSGETPFTHAVSLLRSRANSSSFTQLMEIRTAPFRVESANQNTATWRDPDERLLHCRCARRGFCYMGWVAGSHTESFVACSVRQPPAGRPNCLLCIILFISNSDIGYTMALPLKQLANRLI